jgi:hypothetical protein
MSMKNLLVAVSATLVAFLCQTPAAKASVGLIHCTSATTGLELFVPFAKGGINPMVGTIRLMKNQQALLEATNESVVDYTNTNEDLAFTINDKNDQPTLKAAFRFSEARQRYVGTILYRHSTVGFVCTEE